MKTFTRITGGWKNVPNNLKTKTQLKEMGLKPTAEPVSEVYSGRQWIMLYDEKETVKRKTATPKQLAALEKARIKKEQVLTCDRCEEIQGRKNQMEYTDDGQYCNQCYEKILLDARLREEKEGAIKKLKRWYEDKQLLIMDVETTGVDADDQIVEIGIKDKSGNTLFHSLVKPTCGLMPSAVKAHGITEQMLEGAPLVQEISKELSKLLKGKTLIIFNKEFLYPIIHNSFKNTELNIKELYFECLKHEYQSYIEWPYEFESRFSIQDILERNIARRALEDCSDIIGILNNIWVSLKLK
ncbi:3'-5' exonuclease [Priestia megaterium]